jgi:hypothetical protein
LEITLAVIADAANVSRENKLNVLGIFNRFNARQFPAVHPDFTLVLRLQAGPAERGEQKALVVRLIDADGALVYELGGSFGIPNEPDKPDFQSHVLLSVRGLRIQKPVNHAFHVLINGEEKTRIPLDVHQIEAPMPEEA